MITLLDVNKEIISKLKKSLSKEGHNNIKILESDLSEPIIRPSFKIFMEDPSYEALNSRYRENTVTIEIYFFATDIKKYKLENLKMQSLIETTFIEGLRIDDCFFIPINKVHSEIQDTVLVSSFDIEMVQEIEEDPGEPMEDLNLNI
ncbi:phage tail terminator family protein [Clostridium butyricum]|uniref:phage tail terminator family protein n=1 Tax=Clostridium butyricum TaxID=1492 RepID=UPI002ABD2950|nr:hypothetical protein [Clostridium butyricum]